MIRMVDKLCDNHIVPSRNKHKLSRYGEIMKKQMNECRCYNCDAKISNGRSFKSCSGCMKVFYCSIQC